jgi:hypothetical protein
VVAPGVTSTWLKSVVCQGRVIGVRRASLKEADTVPAYLYPVTCRIFNRQLPVMKPPKRLRPT